MKMRSRTAVAATAVAVAAAVALTGCNPTKDEGPNKTPGSSATQNSGADASAQLKAAADAMKAVTGVHLVMTAEGEVPNLKVSKVEGDVGNKPAPAATGEATISMGDQNVTAKFIYADGHLYSDVAEPGKFTNFGDGASIYNVSIILDPEKGLANVLAKLRDPKDAGTETVNGVETTKITGISSSTDIATLSGSRLGPEKEQAVPTTVWIAKDGTNHLVQLQLQPAPKGTVTIDLSDWGKQVTATKPAE
ncbi:lipoprotein lprA [Mycobacteroides abscessus subsp. abscessus]|uniref:LppX_LprAFG lipoprotein n=1 Tax=Mycobacteroides abscessus TaxID=36809 RepID=UPI0009281D8A|nr:LppX_LprAFG lipoprotein [Mycobacteroides abscessus]SIH34912.1 lipoprotein lprA [Mycobacteroides abscessus subsp. abscessus]